MKTFRLALLSCCLGAVGGLGAPAFANTVQVSGNHLGYDARDGYDNSNRVRFELGSGWIDGPASLRVTADFRGGYAAINQPMRIMLTDLPNDQYLATDFYYYEACYHGNCYPVPTSDSRHFLSYTIENQIAEVGQPGSWTEVGGNPQVLTSDLTPILQSGKSYYLFVEFSGDIWYGAQVPYTLTLSQVPVPASAWLFGSGLLGLTAAGRRGLRKG